MSDATNARKFVKPAHAGASIPDPAHPGLNLPQEGAEVPWDHYWIARERRGEVVMTEQSTTKAG